MLAEYGRQNGFGWKLNEIVGAQIVSVPMAVPLANAAKTLGLSLLLLAAVFAFLIVLLNILLSFSIIHPVLRMSRVAGEASMGKANVEEYVKSGSDELASLSASLNRMKRSMDEAIKLLQPAHGKPLHAQPIGAPVDLGHDSRGSSTTAGGGRAPTRILTDLQGAVKLVPIGGGSPLVLGGDRLVGDGIVLGRDAQCDVVIPETEVSNRHARLSLDGSGMIKVEDLGPAMNLAGI
jgi:HAMP domain-containing protein